jgi:hypothetical protein
VRAGVVIYQFQPGKMDEAVSLWREYVLPAAKQQHGFKGGLLLTEPNTGKGIGIGLWESETDASTFETSGLFQQLIDKFGSVLAKPPVRELYEVSVQV